jgi:hypothetical protein
MNTVVATKEINLSTLPRRSVSEPRMVELPDQKHEQWGLRILCWAVLILLGAVQTWFNRQLMSGDGVSYLDIGDAYFKGDWHNAINGMWSPLYSWLTGGALLLTKPSAYWEYPVIHFVTFGLYVGALAAYEFFLSQVIRTQKTALPVRTLRVLGYALFGWSSLVLMLIRNITADYLTAIVVFLVSGMLLRMRAGRKSWISFALFGGLLGLGYLGKSPMFPLAFVFMAMAFFSIRNIKEAIPRTLVALGAFLLLALPFVYVLSKHQGHFTFSDAGQFAYQSTVNGINQRHWQGGPGNDRPDHPTRVINAAPPVYEFAAPVGGTYPPWFDKSYWYKGARLRFSLGNQLRAVFWNSRVVFREVLLGLSGVLFTGLFLLFYTSRPKRDFFATIVAYLPLLIPPLAVLCLYLLVHMEVRYIAPFVAVALMVVFASTRPIDKRLFTGVTLALSVVLLLSIGMDTAAAVITGARNQRNDYWRVAEGLNSLGVQPGDQVATTKSVLTNAAWARLAHVRIIAEIYANSNDDDGDSIRDEFWEATPVVKQEIIAALAQHGVKALVADSLPPDADTSGWQRVGRTDYGVYLISK